MRRSTRKKLMIQVLVLGPALIVVDRVFLAESVQEASGAAATARGTSSTSEGEDRPEPLSHPALRDALAAARSRSAGDHELIAGLFGAVKPPEPSPAWPPETAQTGEPEQTEEPAPPRPEIPEIRIEGVLDAGPNSAAMVNGRLMRLGETFEGITLVRITGRVVVVSFDGREIPIEVLRPEGRENP